jgi:hypothetical protein
LPPSGVAATRFGGSSICLASSPEVANATSAYSVKPKITERPQAARDDVAAGRLWEASQTLAGFRWQKGREAG